MVELKSRRDIAGLREAGRVVAHAHQAMRAKADVGVTLADLDEVARDVLREHGATSPFLGYRPHFAATPFPGVICASKNDVVVHGIPGDDPLADVLPSDLDLEFEVIRVEPGLLGETDQVAVVDVPPRATRDGQRESAACPSSAVTRHIEQLTEIPLLVGA